MHTMNKTTAVYESGRLGSGALSREQEVEGQLSASAGCNEVEHQSSSVCLDLVVRPADLT